MKLPLTLHPANHLGAQCLLLHAALSSDSVNGVAGDANQHKQFETAASIARLRTRYDWEGQRHPRNIAQLSHCWQGWLQPPSVTAVASVTGSSGSQYTGVEPAAAAPMDRAGAPPSLAPPLPVLSATQQQRAGAYRALAFAAPARLVALHAPRVLLRTLPKKTHDIVSYDAAVHHAALLTELLAPYGVHVALTGATRRGCPFALQAEYLLCLTEAATCEVEAVNPDGAGGVVKKEREEAKHFQKDSGSSASCVISSTADTEGTATNDLPTCAAQRSKKAGGAQMQQRCAGSRIRRDGLMLGPQALSSGSLPTSAAPVASAGAGCGTGHDRQQRVRGLLKESLRRRYCDRREAFSSTDYVSPPVWYRWRRALAGLARCGYVVSAAESFPPSRWWLQTRRAIGLTARYDPHCPTQVPPPACTDAAILCRLQLHRLVLRFCAWHAFAVRQLFLTGPDVFTTHVTMEALERGVDLNMNGAFTFMEKNTTRLDGGVSDVTPPAAAAASAVSDAHGHLFRPEGQEGQQQQHRCCGLAEQLIPRDEEDVVSLAGLPHVDPMLRGLYCQRNHM
ncbi:hypothetical protein LSCM1_08179 [Leishmania martiniquensis]|uniref:Uncharacterized protein n=1 Tax=Leishmania martiniquensis TaxID=1580590 RepID=A0A836H935_9TRYP|nr:hypothetical protein LSCM1_08179 [Leishmania martiniquensis]